MSKTENISLVPYEDEWVHLFRDEAKLLMSKLPEDCLLEFHHIGSTAVPEMPAVPIIDMGVMVTDYKLAKEKIIPLLEKDGYEFFLEEQGGKPFLTFVKRNADGERTHHIYMAEEEHDFWDRLYFREFLKKYREEARSYFELKDKLQKEHSDNWEQYHLAKSDFVAEKTAKAKEVIEEI